jgi:hypothetical protein
MIKQSSMNPGKHREDKTEPGAVRILFLLNAVHSTLLPGTPFVVFAEMSGHGSGSTKQRM